MNECRELFGTKFQRMSVREGFMKVLAVLYKGECIEEASLMNFLEFVDAINELGDDYEIRGDEDVIIIKIFDKMTKKLRDKYAILRYAGEYIFINRKLQHQLLEDSSISVKECYVTADEYYVCKITFGKINYVRDTN